MQHPLIKYFYPSQDISLFRALFTCLFPLFAEKKPKSKHLSFNDQHLLYYSTHCAPGFSNTNLVVDKGVPNQLKKPFVIRLAKFTIISMARMCHKHASFSKENLFFEVLEA